MGLFGGDNDTSDFVQHEKIKLGTLNTLIRIIDWEAKVVIYRDTSKDGYTSVPLSQTDISVDDAPDEIQRALERTE